VDFDRLPPGEAVAASGKLLPSPDPFVMRGGYREFEGSLVPPWASTKAPTKKACLAFLEAAEVAAEAGREALRRDYSDKWASQLFGKKGADKADKAGHEKGLVRASKDPEASLALRLAHAMLKPMGSKRRFTVAVTGQSNCAGHGSYFDETWTFVMGRGAAGAFKQAGVDLAVQNFALGGGRTLPTTGWCGESQVRHRAARPTRRAHVCTWGVATKQVWMSHLDCARWGVCRGGASCVVGVAGRQVGPSVDHAVWDFTMTEGGKSEIQVRP
jgi:hypothetical protein